MSAKIRLTRDTAAPTDPVTINGLALHQGGKPLTAGDVPEGHEIEYDPETGEVLSIAPVEDKPEDDKGGDGETAV